MHYTGTIWRPPYEASSLLLEVTAGCTHHCCKFCTLYHDLPFPFKMSPLEVIEADLKEAQEAYALKNQQTSRLFLTGANPFALTSEKLLAIAALIYQYFPDNKTIGCFARITDITSKTDDELALLRQAGYNSITIGMETGDDEALTFMHKGYLAQDIITQCQRLDHANISYRFFYLTGISGARKGEKSAQATATVCNQLHPQLIGANMLTVYPDSLLYQEIQKGNWQEAKELEKYQELKILVENLTIPVQFAAFGASNAIPIYGKLPQDKENILLTLDKIITTIAEDDLRYYRKNLRHL